MTRLFGTDGVRGIPGRSPLTAELVRRLGVAAGRVFAERGGRRPARNGAAPFVLMGRDTRESGAALGKELAKGLARAGFNVLDVGVLPTPAVSYLIPRRGAALGVVISASHNPPEFNGIKFLSASGAKLPADIEAQIETRIAACSDPAAQSLSGRLTREGGAAPAYMDFLRSTFPATLDLSGMRLVVDGANGAASEAAPALFRCLGAEVFEIGCSPNGRNINKRCGALDTARMRHEVTRRRADGGIALDGDADRVLLADERGRGIDGDALIAFQALRLKRAGLLKGGKVVVTVMSNLGMIRFLRERGIGSVEVPVGDRNVAEALDAGGLILGGENSGHVVFRHLAPSGDGLLTALQTLAALREAGGRLSRVRSLYRVFPQILRNVRVHRRIPLDKLRSFAARIKKCRVKLKNSGRIFVRYSGTEPLLRILVEGPERGAIGRIAEELVLAFKDEVRAKF